MPAATDAARLRRATEEFVTGINADLRSKAGLSAIEKRRLRAEIETCTQMLDELRSKLSG
jgi:hypothetical protein